jgi:hypothetical protein
VADEIDPAAVGVFFRLAPKGLTVSELREAIEGINNTYEILAICLVTSVIHEAPESLLVDIRG